MNEVRGFKARLLGAKSALERLELELQVEPRRVIQRDVFYHVPVGKLKIREQDGSWQIMHYSKAQDSLGGEVMCYEVEAINDGKGLMRVLKSALGEAGTVEKVRWLFASKEWCVHLDRVAELGWFIELEYFINEEGARDRAADMAEEIRGRFEIRDSDICEGSYIDLFP